MFDRVCFVLCCICFVLLLILVCVCFELLGFALVEFVSVFSVLCCWAGLTIDFGDVAWWELFDVYF